MLRRRILVQGNETVFVDSSGGILGYLHAWTDTADGSDDGAVVRYGYGFKSADGDWLGGSYEDLENGWSNSNTVEAARDEAGAQLYWDLAAYEAGGSVDIEDGFTSTDTDDGLPEIRKRLAAMRILRMTGRCHSSGM